MYNLNYLFMKRVCKILICLIAMTYAPFVGSGKETDKANGDKKYHEMAYLSPALPPAYTRAAVTTPSRWRLGGNIGFGFNDDFTNINIAPKIGYALTKGVTVGGGVSYNYYENKRYDFSENYFGMNLFASLHPVQYITIFIQPEGQRRWGKDQWGHSTSEFLPCFLVGGGVIIPTGGRSGMSITFYYDVIRNDHSPYGDHIGYSVGYTFML